MYLCILVLPFLSFFSTNLLGRFIGIRGCCILATVSILSSFLLFRRRKTGRRCKLSCHKTRLRGLNRSGFLFQQSYHKDHTHQASARNPQDKTSPFQHDSCHNQGHDDQEDTDLDESKKEVVQCIHGNLL